MNDGAPKTQSGMLIAIFGLLVILIVVVLFLFVQQKNNAQQLNQIKTQVDSANHSLLMIRRRTTHPPETYELFGKTLPYGPLMREMDRVFRQQIVNNRNTTHETIRRVISYTDRVTVIRQGARKRGIPEDILYLFVQESRLSDRATSPMAAVGACQFIMSTAGDYGLQIISGVLDERRSFLHCVDASFNYFEDMVQRFIDHPDIDASDMANVWYLVAAGYNHGFTGVREKIERRGSSDYFDLRLILPRETRWYIPNIAIKKEIITNYEKYGFDLIDTEPVATICMKQQRVEVSSPVRLYDIAMDSLGFGDFDYSNARFSDTEHETTALNFFRFCNPQILLEDFEDELPSIRERPYYIFNVPERPISTFNTRW